MSETPAEWRARYDAHLLSSYWDTLRRDVVARANGTCEHCHKRKVYQVHHLHYDTMGHETLLDVKGVCGRCHRYLHGRKRKGGPKKPRQTRRPIKKRPASLHHLKPSSVPPPPVTRIESLPGNWSFRDRLIASLRHG